MSLPDNVLAIIKAESASSHSQHMTEAKSNIANANNILRHSAVRQVDEPGPAQARAVDKILRLPNG
mgnify:CR=1 FL=1